MCLSYCLCLCGFFAFAAGFTISAISISFLVNGDEHIPGKYGSLEWYAWLPFACGVLVMFGAIVSCWCAKHDKRNACFDSIFATVVFATGVVIIAAGGIVVVTIRRYMHNMVLKSEVTSGLEAGIGGKQQEFSDFMLGLADGCCSTFSIPDCSEGFYAEDAYRYCYLDSDSYETGVEVAFDAGDAYCGKVGLPQACESSSVHNFLRVNYDYLRQNVLPAGIVLVTTGCLLVLGACYCLDCHKVLKNRDDKPKTYDEFAQHLHYGKNHQLVMA
mmetsp:Transcript_3047/g.3626  ORF Transcript_3047/g.3626 Transcript_3047/m.3626 type:complete len:272 (+) Transcript_3047:107-922(+)